MRVVSEYHLYGQKTCPDCNVEYHDSFDDCPRCKPEIITYEEAAESRIKELEELPCYFEWFWNSDKKMTCVTKDVKQCPVCLLRAGVDKRTTKK